MVSINEELEVAKAAKAAIKALLTAKSKSAVLATFKHAYRAAVLNLSSRGTLNEARRKVGITLSNIRHGPPTKEKILRGQRSNRRLDNGIGTQLMKATSARPRSTHVYVDMNLLGESAREENE